MQDSKNTLNNENQEMNNNENTSAKDVVEVTEQAPGHVKIEESALEKGKGIEVSENLEGTKESDVTKNVRKSGEVPLLEVKNLKLYFPHGRGKNRAYTKAVDDVSFFINKGEVFGLVGESGCGKTTTGRTIIRLYEPTSGDIYLNGKLISKELSKEETREVTSKVQMIFQDPVASLNPRMTVQDIIGEGLKINNLVKDENEMLEKVYKVLETVGLTKEHATRYPHEFSGGQRQRIGIARAIITHPDLIIADEPVSALDVSIQAQVLNLLGKLKKELGLTILFIAHNLSVVKYFSDKIGVMYFGKLVEYADSEEIYRNPIHPYTKSLLSAIPVPDPFFEKMRKRISYDPSVHDYSIEPPTHREILPGHYVYCNEMEYKMYIDEQKKKNIPVNPVIESAKVDKIL